MNIYIINEGSVDHRAALSSVLLEATLSSLNYLYLQGLQQALVLRLPRCR